MHKKLGLKIRMHKSSYTTRTRWHGWWNT